ARPAALHEREEGSFPLSPTLPRRGGGSNEEARREVIDDAFVFDSVAHVFNFEKENALGQPGQMFSNHLYSFHAALTPSGDTVLPAESFLHNWTVDEIDEMDVG